VRSSRHYNTEIGLEEDGWLSLHIIQAERALRRGWCLCKEVWACQECRPKVASYLYILADRVAIMYVMCMSTMMWLRDGGLHEYTRDYTAYKRHSLEYIHGVSLYYPSMFLRMWLESTSGLTPNDLQHNLAWLSRCTTSEYGVEGATTSPSHRSDIEYTNVQCREQAWLVRLPSEWGNSWGLQSLRESKIPEQLLFVRYIQRQEIELSKLASSFSSEPVILLV